MLAKYSVKKPLTVILAGVGDAAGNIGQTMDDLLDELDDALSSADSSDEIAVTQKEAPAKWPGLRFRLSQVSWNTLRRVSHTPSSSLVFSVTNRQPASRSGWPFFMP